MYTVYCKVYTVYSVQLLGSFFDWSLGGIVASVTMSETEEEGSIKKKEGGEILDERPHERIAAMRR